MKNWKIIKRICANGEYRAAIVDECGRFVIATEQYRKKSGLAKGILSIRHNSQNPDAYVRKTTKDGRFYFNMKSVGNHRIIAGASRICKTEDERDQLMSAMFANLHNADEKTKIGFFSLTFDQKYGIIKKEEE